MRSAHKFDKLTPFYLHDELQVCLCILSCRAVELGWDRASDYLLKAGSQSLYFGRDPLGRRSLLVHWPTLRRPYFVLSSVSDGADSQVFSFEELETGFLFRLWLSDMRSDTVSRFLIDCSC